MGDSGRKRWKGAVSSPKRSCHEEHTSITAAETDEGVLKTKHECL